MVAVAHAQVGVEVVHLCRVGMAGNKDDIDDGDDDGDDGGGGGGVSTIMPVPLWVNFAHSTVLKPHSSCSSMWSTLTN